MLRQAKTAPYKTPHHPLAPLLAPECRKACTRNGWKHWRRRSGNWGRKSGQRWRICFARIRKADRLRYGTGWGGSNPDREGAPYRLVSHLEKCGGFCEGSTDIEAGRVLPAGGRPEAGRCAANKCRIVCPAGPSGGEQRAGGTVIPKNLHARFQNIQVAVVMPPTDQGLASFSNAMRK